MKRKSLWVTCALTGAIAASVAGTATPAAAVGGTGETASAAPVKVSTGVVDMKVTLLGGLVQLPVKTTLVQTTDLLLSQKAPAHTVYRTIPSAPTLVDDVYRSEGQPVPRLTSCSADAWSAGSDATVSAAVFGASGLSYGADLVRFTAVGSCGGAAHAFTQRVQWGSGAAARQVLASQSQIVGLKVGLPGGLLAPLDEVLSAGVISSRSACPSAATGSMPPAAWVGTTNLRVLNALGISIGRDGRIATITRLSDGASIPVQTALGVDIGVPGLLADLTLQPDGRLRVRVAADTQEAAELLLGDVGKLLGGVLGVRTGVEVSLGAARSTDVTAGTATATGLRLDAAITVGATGAVRITNTAGTGDGRIGVATLELATSRCAWSPTGSPGSSWLDPTIT